MGFEQLPGAIQVPNVTFTQDNVAFDDDSLADEVALAIVLADTQTAESYVLGKSLVTSWDLADDLVRAYVKPKVWPGTDTPRANLGMPVVLEAIEKVLPALYMPLFSRQQPFELKPVGRTTPAAARAKGHLLNWAIKQAGFKEEIRLAFKTCLQYGFFVGNWGWLESTEKAKSYEIVQNDDGERIVKKIVKENEVSQPTFETLDLRKVLVDPGCNTQDVRKSAKFLIKQKFITANGLDDLRDDPSYKHVPTRDQLALILAPMGEPTENSMKGSQTNTWRDLQAEPAEKATSVDPLQQPLEILEYWTSERVITVLQRKIVIRNEENEFDRLPFVSCAFIDVLNSAHGYGIAKLLSGEQRFQQGVINSWIDSLALTLNPAFQLMKGIGPGAQQVRVSPGKVITESGELKPLVAPSVSMEAMSAIGGSEMRANRRVAANSGAGMPNQALRTAEGIQSFTGDVVQRLQYFLEIFIDMVFVPVLEAFLELCTDHLSPKQVEAILSDADSQAYQGDLKDVYNATCTVEVLAGTKLMARIAAAQMVPIIITMLSSQSVQDSFVVQNKKFNYEEFIEEALELTGWDVGVLIGDMSPDDQKRAMMMQPGAVKAMGDQQLEATKHQNDLENITEKGFTQAGVAVVRQAAKSHMDEAAQALEAMNGGQNGQ